jgi:hypothetical protein
MALHEVEKDGHKQLLNDEEYSNHVLWDGCLKYIVYGFIILGLITYFVTN